MQIELDDFKKIIDPIKSTLLGISLSNHGEPLLHENLSKLIRYAHSNNIAVSFPTNLSLKLDEETVEGIVTSGLDSIMVSLDGASENTYNKYRVGGNYELVLRNVENIAQKKLQYGQRRPMLIWKFIVFDHNKHEVNVVKKTHKLLGFDSYTLVQDRQSEISIKSRQKYMSRIYQKNQGCFWLWYAIITRWDGKVFPCCKPKSFDLGNAITEDTRDIWCSDNYQSLRRAFTKEEYRKEMNPICRKCLGLELDNSGKTGSESI
jgi:MoaA/NifB/PqqE/SkfB family radical SAM enzyme